MPKHNAHILIKRKNRYIVDNTVNLIVWTFSIMHDNYCFVSAVFLHLRVLLLKVVFLCYDMQISIWSYFPLSSLFQCSTLGLQLSCVKPTVRCSQMGWMGYSTNNQVPRVECLCLSLNGLSHHLQRMNMRCLRCQHCKWILGLWALITTGRHLFQTCFNQHTWWSKGNNAAALCCLINFLFKEDAKYV